MWYAGEIFHILFYKIQRLHREYALQALRVQTISVINRSVICRFFTGTAIIAAIFSVIAGGFPTLQASPCKVGKRPLYFFADTTLATRLPETFQVRLYAQLVTPLDEIGYCLSEYHSGVLSDTAVQEEMVMCLSMVPVISEKTLLLPEGADAPDSTVNVSSLNMALFDTTAQMEVALVRAGAMLRNNGRPWERTSPLLTVTCHPDELATFESVLIRKIIENLRDQYICHLKIESAPEGAVIRSKSGLEGITPLEWIIPVGKLKVTGELEGYEPIRRTIDLSEPGSHMYRLEMGRKRFYHSRFFVSGLVLGASSAICYGIDRFFYNEYRRLGKEDRVNAPEQFGKKFAVAKNFERAAGVTLALAGVSLVFSFVF